MARFAGLLGLSLVSMVLASCAGPGQPSKTDLARCETSAFKEGLRNERSRIREQTVRALARCPQAFSERTLSKVAVDVNEKPWVRRAAVEGLAEAQWGFATLVQLGTDPGVDRELKVSVATALARYPRPEACEVLGFMTSQDDLLLQASAQASLRRLAEGSSACPQP